jgi:N-acetylmuramoyl-L-alanine amidase
VPAPRKSEIIVCGKRYDVEHPVVTFDDEDGLSAYVPHRTDDISEIYAYDPAPGLSQRATRYRTRRAMGQNSTSLSMLRQVVRQFVVHLDGCMSAKMCYEVLHNQRGLSVHFMVDNDGTIYQTLDLVHCAFHAGGVNEVSVGVEMQNKGDAARYPKAYPDGRNKVTCRIHGQQFLAYDFTDPQYEAMIKLCRAITRILDIPLTSPHKDGQPVWTTIPDVRSYRGFIGHYHIIEEKWDPGPWDFQRFLHGIGSRVTFPFSALSSSGEEQAVDKLAAPYFENSEQDVEVHFPVGPLGESRLWHGGVHLHAPLGSPIRSVMRGRLVAARLAPACPVGSCSFVLMRHDFTIGRAWTIFSLCFHIGSPDESQEEWPWLKRARDEGSQAALTRGEVALLGINIEPGEVIGSVGEAGPPGYRGEEFHFAIFSSEELGRELEAGAWDVIEGSEASRLCTDRGIISRIDRPSGGVPADGLLSRRELRNFFRQSQRRTELHRIAVRYKSEWTPGGWAEELSRAPDFAQLAPAQRQRLLSQQILPTLWWTPEVARHAGLPANGVIYAYHPIAFLVWLDRTARRFSSARGKGIEGADRWEGKQAPKRFTVDAESGLSMTDDEDFHTGELGKKLTLEDLVNGYSDED